MPGLAKRVGPVAFGDTPSGFMQGSHYVRQEQLLKAKAISLRLVIG
jgi:hypothetical protein